jgi:Cof subfamily protein (haloacid dehalogenase superfamily)
VGHGTEAPVVSVSLICLDVDGTLVGSRGEPTDAVWAAAARARERGQHLAMCTARVALGPSWKWAQNLDHDGWHAFHNGAALIHAGSGERKEVPLARGDWEPMAETCQARGWVVEGYTATELAVDSDDQLAVAHAALLSIDHRRRSIDALEDPILRLQVMCRLDEASAVEDVVPPTLDAAVATSPMMPGVALVSITRGGINKGRAVRDLAALAGVDLGAVMMVGDGQNDLDAFRVAGVSVAMGNADPLCLDAATHRVPTVDEDGAAVAIDASGGW